MPGCIVSATTASFISVENRRRRATPVITSTFENVSDIGVCLGLSLGPPAKAGVRSKQGAVQDPGFRDRLRRATGRTLRVPTLAERLQRDGALIMSNVSPGAAYFHDPDGFGSVYHRAGSYGPGGHALASGEQLDIALGAAGDATMTERFCAALSRPKPS